MKRAKILVIEGTDGSGKETQSKRLEQNLINQGYRVKRYSFPIYEKPLPSSFKNEDIFSRIKFCNIFSFIFSL